MSWVWIAGAAWVVAAIAAALLIGRAIDTADREAAEELEKTPNFVVDPELLHLTPGTAAADDALPPAGRPPLPASKPPASTIPGLPSARPPVGRPPVPPPVRRGHRESGVG